MNHLTQNEAVLFQDLIVRMERNNNAMLRLLQKLESYTCEPNNRSCFEKLYELKQDFKDFSNRHHALMGHLKSRRFINSDLDFEVQKHLKSYKKLESDMAAYILVTNQYA